MAEVSGTASLGLKYGLEGKKGFGKYDSLTPHHSLTIKRQVSDDLTDVELVTKALELNALCEAEVKKLMNKELTEARNIP